MNPKYQKPRENTMPQTNYIHDIQRRAGIQVFESAKQRYMQQFQGLIQKADDPNYGSTRNNDFIRKMVEKQITWARSALKRDDRITWYLRFVKVSLVNDFQDGPIREREYQRLLKTTGIADLESMRNAAAAIVSSRFQNSMDHFLSLPIHEIQELVWDRQDHGDIMDYMTTMEQEWIETRDRMLDASENTGAELVIQFPDGFAWWNLKQAYCNQEADAMGHCGNSPRSNTDDSILSLRKRTHMGDHTGDTPFLTFILDWRGRLTEMKGRGNDKPAERYHPYIVELLKHPIVKGVQGGGYLPENNFSLNDLDDEVREELYELKGELQPFDLRYYKIMKEVTGQEVPIEFQREAMNILYEFNIDNDHFDMSNRYWSIVDRVDGIGNFADYYDDTKMSRAISLYEEIQDGEGVVITANDGDDIDLSQIKDEWILKGFALMPQEARKRVYSGTGHHPRDIKNGGLTRFYHGFIENFHDEIMVAIKNTVDISIASHNEELYQLDNIKAFINDLLLRYRFSLNLNPFIIEDKKDFLDSDVAFQISTNELVDIIGHLGADFGDDYDDEASYYAASLREYGWQHILEFDDDIVPESELYDEYSEMFEKDIEDINLKISDVDVEVFSKELEKSILGQHRDENPNQEELNLESLKRRAGIL